MFYITLVFEPHLLLLRLFQPESRLKRCLLTFQYVPSALQFFGQ